MDAITDVGGIDFNKFHNVHFGLDIKEILKVGSGKARLDKKIVNPCSMAAHVKLVRSMRSEGSSSKMRWVSGEFTSIRFESKCPWIASGAVMSEAQDLRSKLKVIRT